MVKRFTDAHKKAEYIQEKTKSYPSSNIGLIPNHSQGTALKKLTNSKHSKEWNEAFKEFNQVLSRCKSKACYSMNSFILSLPPKASKVEDKKAMVELVSSLLADCGFWFDEVRPTAPNQLPPEELAAALNPEGRIAHHATRDEARTVTEVLEELYEIYTPREEARQKPFTDIGVRKRSKILIKPPAIYELEKRADPKIEDWFSIRIRLVNEEKGTSQHNLETWVDDIARNNGLKGDEVQAYMEEPLLDINGSPQVDSAGMPISLNAAVKHLFKIVFRLYNDQDRASSVLKENPGKSVEAFKLYKATAENKAKIESVWMDPRLLYLKSNQLLSNLKKQFCSVINCDKKGENLLKMSEIIEGMYEERTEERTEELETILENNVKASAEKLRDLFRMYHKIHGNRDLTAIMQKLLLFSCNMIFQLSNEDAEEAPSLAPVVTFFLFCNYTAEIGEKKVNEISFDTLFNREIELDKTSQIDFISLFENLCNIYIEFYGNCLAKIDPSYLEGDQLKKSYLHEWILAFEELTGLQTYSFTKCFDGEASLFQREHPYYSHINKCLEANFKMEAHTFLDRHKEWLPSFLPLLHGGAAHSAIEELTFLLRAQRDASGTDGTCILKSYQDLFCTANSFVTIRKSLYAFFGNLYIDPNKTFIPTGTVFTAACHEFNDKHKLSEVFPAWYSDVRERCNILLEFGIRKISTEDCAERLMDYINECIAYILNNTDIEWPS